jgi:hypothetical protein
VVAQVGNLYTVYTHCCKTFLRYLNFLLFFNFIFVSGDFLIFFSYNIQYCFICCPSDSTVPTDAGVEPRTVATGALEVRRSNHYRLDLISLLLDISQPFSFTNEKIYFYVICTCTLSVFYRFYRLAGKFLLLYRFRVASGLQYLRIQ